MPSWTSVIAFHGGLACLWLLTLPTGPPHVGQGLSSKTIVLTGGTSGLGRAAVELFAQRGDTVYTCGRNAAKVRELNLLDRVHASVVDVSRPEEMNHWASVVNKSVSAIDVLINNAGQLRIGDPAAAITVTSYSAVMDTNLRGAVVATTAFWSMLRRPTGKVINMGSTVETPKLSQAFHSIYSMSKCALRAYSVGLRQEGRLCGVSVVHVKAGAFESNLHDAFDEAENTLAGYPFEFSMHASAFQTGIKAKLSMVTERSSAEFAGHLYSISHQHKPADEYWLNVSWLEMLAELLPQWLLDFVVMQDYPSDGVKHAEL